MERRSGIAGLTGLFKESVADVPDGARVAFTGSVGVCTPFAELLAYAVKDRRFDLTYVPLADASQARAMRWTEGVGFSVGEERTELAADALVVLGGLAMPKFGRPVEEVAALIERLGRPKVIGVCFMDIFQRSGWAERLPFNAIINADLEVSARSFREEG